MDFAFNWWHIKESTCDPNYPKFQRKHDQAGHLGNSNLTELKDQT